MVVTTEQFLELNQFAVDWSCVAVTQKTGNRNAPDEIGGHVLRRDCLGLFECSDKEKKCTYSVRPKVKKILQDKQEAGLTICPICQSPIIRLDCPAKMFVTQWTGYASFRHVGEHSHGRPESMHMSQLQKAAVYRTFDTHPDAGPRKLATGVPSASGPGHPLRDIHPRLGNPDAIKAVRRDWKKTLPLPGGDDFINAFQQFAAETGDFVQEMKFTGTIVVVPLQTRHMLDQSIAIMDITVPLDIDPVFGLCADAAHGYFQDRNAVLMSTAKYCPKAHRWESVLFAYSNGQTIEHWRHYFFVLFYKMRSAAGAAWQKEMAALMADFSLAIDAGASLGYCDAAHACGDNRPNAELSEEFSVLVKGCEHHYRTGVRQLAMSVIPPEERSLFKEQAMALVTAATEEEFQEISKTLLQQYPIITGWLEWWQRVPTRRKLFAAYKIMDDSLNRSMPSTNNPEEALHFKFYKSVGKHHPLMKGLRGLWKIAQTAEVEYNRIISGKKIRYGQHEGWKKVKARLGRTKMTRRKQTKAIFTRRRYKNDGRAPDRLAALQRLAKKHAKAKKGQQSPATAPAYDGSDDEKNPKRSAKRGHQLVIGSDDEDLGVESNKRPRLDFDVNMATQFIQKLQHAVPSSITSYKWQKNSCWLDSSAELLFWAVVPHMAEFFEAFAKTQGCSGLLLLRNLVQQRLQWMMQAEASSRLDLLQADLVIQKESLRSFMHENLKSGLYDDDTRTSYRPLFVSHTVNV